MVSFSVGMTFIYGALSVGLPFDLRAWFFGIIAALIDLGEEIAADAMDMEGDLLIHSNSLAIKYGRDFALKISAVHLLFCDITYINSFYLRLVSKNISVADRNNGYCDSLSNLEIIEI